MAYFIFLKNFENVSGSLYRITENESDLNNLNITQSDYKILEDSQENFNYVKLNIKSADKYNNNSITYVDNNVIFNNLKNIENHINLLKISIKNFTDNNSNHVLYNRWNSYYNQLNNLDLNSITYPLNKSLEQYFNDLGQPSYNILQLP
jgi:hypothetical protein